MRTRDGRDDDYVAMCLLHDIGDTLAPRNHGELAASILKPFVSERLTWITKHHPVFQLYYYGRHVGADPDAREHYAGHQWFDDTVEFCELYDENCFDTNYPSQPLDEFAPLAARAAAAHTAVGSARSLTLRCSRARRASVRRLSCMTDT